jgi:predicted nucleic acid-binding protein
MGKKYFIDTNAIIDYTSGLYSKKGLTFMDKVVNQSINISVISKIEALAFAPQTELQNAFFQLVVEFVNNANVYALDDEIIDTTIEIRKTYKLKLPDAIIAATALNNGLILISRNTKDFDKVPEIHIINPHDI